MNEPQEQTAWDKVLSGLWVWRLLSWELTAQFNEIITGRGPETTAFPLEELPL